MQCIETCTFDWNDMELGMGTVNIPVWPQQFIFLNGVSSYALLRVNLQNDHYSTGMFHKTLLSRRFSKHPTKTEDLSTLFLTPQKN